MRRVACIVAAALSLAASAASTADFYQGKQVTIVVGFSAAGTYDATARLFARHLGKHLAGKPTVIVRNMPGAGSLVATNSLYSSLPKDGTTLGVVGGGIVLEPLLNNPQATYDARRFNWIGGRTPDNFLCLVWHTVPVNALQDVMRRETVVGATGPGSRTLTYPKALNELLGTKFKIVSGYPGGNEITLARSKAIAAGRSAASRPARRTGSATARSGRSRSSRWRNPACFRTCRWRPISQAPITDAARSSSSPPTRFWPGRWWRHRTCRRSVWPICARPSMR